MNEFVNIFLIVLAFLRRDCARFWEFFCFPSRGNRVSPS